MKALQVSRRAPGRSFFFTFGAWTMVRNLVATVFRLFWGAQFRARHHVPATGPLVIVANHQSHFDPPLVGCVVSDRPCGFMARESLFKFKPFGWLIGFLGAIPLRREKTDAGAMRSAIAELEAGRTVLIFPEGTRTRDGAVGRFKRGFLMLVEQTGASVVPVAIEGAHDVWPVGQSWPRLGGPILVEAAPAITADDLLRDGPDAAIERVRRTIDEMRSRLCAEIDAWAVRREAASA